MRQHKCPVPCCPDVVGDYSTFCQRCSCVLGTDGINRLEVLRKGGHEHAMKESAEYKNEVTYLASMLFLDIAPGFREPGEEG